MFKSDIDKSKSNSNIFEHKLYLNSSIFDANYLRSYTEMGWIGMEFANLLTHPTREEGVLTKNKYNRQPRPPSNPTPQSRRKLL